MQKIAADFEKDTGHKAVLAFGSTGKFYAQINNGAPFEVLLAADDETPARARERGPAVPGTRFTYATGRLVLWSAQPGVVDEKGEVLARRGKTRIAIADPQARALRRGRRETMRGSGLVAGLQPRFVQGENIAQTYQFVATGNAHLGFVALSQVMVDGRHQKGSAWIVPATLHSRSARTPSCCHRARTTRGCRLAAYLKRSKARAIIRSYGYEI